MSCLTCAEQSFFRDCRTSLAGRTFLAMKLDFSRGGIGQLWITGALPPMLKQAKGRDVKAQLSGKSDSPFPPALMPIGDLLCSERPKPLQHAVTLLLSFPHSVTVSPAVQDDNGGGRCRVRPSMASFASH